jgi:hypothetical protein
MITRTEPQRIDVTPSRTGWTVSAGGATHAVFVGKNARERALDWALRLAEARRPEVPVLVVVANPGDGGATHGRLAS